MSSAADRAREKAARLAAKSSAEPVGQQPDTALLHAVSTAKVVDRKPVRFTIDLAAPRHDALEDWTRDAGRSLGFRVSKADVVRELLRRLEQDDELAEDIRSALRAQH